MILTIKITKDVLLRSLMCGTKEFVGKPSTNCAIALAVRDLFPNALVGDTRIHFGNKDNSFYVLPKEAQAFIKMFDDLFNKPVKRLGFEGFQFKIEVPEAVIDSIGLEEVYKILNNHQSMELVK